jgi:hypothetical protein
MESSQRLRHYGPTVIFRPSCWRARRPDFYRVHQTIRPPSTNLDRNRLGQRIVPISLSQPAIIGLLIFFFKKSSYSIQENNNLRNNLIDRNTTKCWARLSTYCCTPFWRSWLRTCVSTNSSIGLGSRPRDVACKEKKRLQVKYIYKQQ